MGRVLQAESHTVELPFVLAAERDAADRLDAQVVPAHAVQHDHLERRRRRNSCPSADPGGRRAVERRQPSRVARTIGIAELGNRRRGDSFQTSRSAGGAGITSSTA